jgi:hypothetical protein
MNLHGTEGNFNPPHPEISAKIKSGRRLDAMLISSSSPIPALFMVLIKLSGVQGRD